MTYSQMYFRAKIVRWAATLAQRQSDRENKRNLKDPGSQPGQPSLDVLDWLCKWWGKGLYTRNTNFVSHDTTLGRAT
jgi:hypothetical protein